MLCVLLLYSLQYSPRSWEPLFEETSIHFDAAGQGRTPVIAHYNTCVSYADKEEHLLLLITTHAYRALI